MLAQTAPDAAPVARSMVYPRAQDRRINQALDVSPAPADDLVARLLQTAARVPTAIAVEADDGTLSYAELARQVTALAQRLRAQWDDRTEEPRVGVSLPRGATELVTLLAVLAAGAAYVPLDPSHPRERLALVLEDAAPHVLVVHPDTALPLDGPHAVLVLDALPTVDADAPTCPPWPPPGPQALAYVMFTSGSTGRPKGVEVPRGALSNFLRSMARAPGLSEGERLLAITTTAFDIAGLELYLPLWVGATVVIASTETTRDPRRLRQRLERGDVTTMQATPATWRLLLEAGWRGDGRLRMLCGGEALPPGLAERLRAAGSELWNMYGPTETTIWSSIERIEPDQGCITIGRPIDHTTMVVVDEQLQPVPPGTDGELCIGGRGLARGYRGRPELTAERFPIAPDGQRLHRTGDRCRQLPDGRVQWLGRLDHQVKIRGFRVELGEIEACLAAVPGVTQVAVLAHQRADGEPLLAAYWVGQAERPALVEAARRRLPAYMVPATWDRLERFVLNANGKIDRARLPAPRPGGDDGVPVERPRSDTETRVAAVWRDVLGLAEVPADRDFFTLGGTSALAARVVATLQEQTASEIPLQAIYEGPTVAGLAARIRHGLRRDGPIVVPLRHGAPGRTPVLCLLGVHLYQDLALALPDDRTVIGIHVPCRYVPGRDPPPTLEVIAARYVEVVREHQPHGPYHLLGLCFGGIVAYEVASRLLAAGERVETVVVIDAVLPSAVRVHPVRRLRSMVEVLPLLLREPQQLRRRLRRRRERLRARVGRLQPRSRGAAGPVDLPIDGPEVEAEVQRFCAVQRRIDAQLLVVRATGEPTPAWREVAPDQGWGGRAARVRVHDVPADHLGVLREPHVRSLVRALSAALE